MPIISRILRSISAYYGKVRPYVQWIPSPKDHPWVTASLTTAALYITLPAFLLLRKCPEPRPLSARKTELEILKNRTWDDQAYVVVLGGKGIGKSCLVDTYNSKRRGVVDFDVYPDTDGKSIVNDALRSVTKLTLGYYFFLEYRALWAIYLYKRFTFGKSPILVIRARERVPQHNKPYADLTSAVRILTERYGFHVIVDGSPNAVDPGLLSTLRQDVINVEPYSQADLWNIKEFQGLSKDLEELGWKAVVWFVLGGVPRCYQVIRNDWIARVERDREGKMTNADKETLRVIVWNVLKSQIKESIKYVRDAKVKHPQMKSILKLLDKDTLQVSAEVVAKENLERPNPDRVLRELWINGKCFFVPATPAIQLVLKYSLEEIPSTLEELAKLIGIVIKDNLEAVPSSPEKVAELLKPK